MSQKLGDKTEDEYEMDIDFGLLMKTDRLKIGIDAARILRGNPNVYAGIEYTLIDLNHNVNVKTRVGANTNSDITLGVGALMNPLTIDYAYMIRSSGTEHVFSVGIAFDDNAKAIRQQKAREYYQVAIRAAEANKMEEVVVNLQKGIHEDPDNLDLKGMMKRLVDIRIYGEYAGMLADNKQYMRLYNDALYAYIINNYDKALENVEYLVKKTNREKVKELRDTLEAYTKKRYTYKDQEMISKLLEQAISEIMVDRLEQANKLLNRVLYLEPGNIIALKRLGSNYYITDKKAEARQLWEKVKEISPTDKEVKKLLEQK